MLNTTYAERKRSIILFLSFLTVPVIIYFYFFNWQTVSAFGDDLYIFKEYSRLENISDKINLPVSFGKYRPVHGFNIYLLAEWFQKDLQAFYLFNVLVQTIIAFLSAAILNLFLKSLNLSLLCGLLIGLSRFSFFNIAQLFNGGALEGMAMVFFLLSLYVLLNAASGDSLTNSQKQKRIIWSIVFANLSMYTHERYILMLPAIVLVILLLPSFKNISRKQKTGLCLLVIFSIVLNVLLKKNVYGLPFFVGTAGTNISLSPVTVLSFFHDAVFSIFQINSGPDYLSGISFSALSLLSKALAIILLVAILAILVSYLAKVRRFFKLKQKDKQNEFFMFLFIFLLTVLFLVPAVITIRLEPRWLQASFALFMIGMTIAFKNLSFKSGDTKKYLFVTFIGLFFIVDATYFIKGVNNLSSSYSVRLASQVKKAITKDVIKPAADRVYIWEAKRNENSEAEINWVLSGGYFFNFYQGKDKEIYFADSAYRRNYPFAVSSFAKFNKDKDQIIYIGTDVYDITKYYLKDSLKSFTNERIALLNRAAEMRYDPNQLLITNNDFDKFNTTGFYEKENDIRWTSGNATFEFRADYVLQDSIELDLSTYMPPICKNINPKVSLIDKDNKEHQPVLSSRVEDKFIYKFFFDQPAAIRKIKLLADTINAKPDSRNLAFPFISLEIKN